MDEPLTAARRLLDTAKPGEQLEIFSLASETHGYEWAGGRLERSEHKQQSGFALRVFSAGRMGFSFRVDTRPQALAEAVDEARALCRVSEPDPCRGLPEVREPAEVLLPPPCDLQAVPESAKLAWLQRMEAAALACDRSIQSVQQASYQERVWHFGLANSLGLERKWSKQEFSLAAAALAAQSQDIQLGEEYRTWTVRDELDPEGVGRAAGERAFCLLGATPLATGTRDLVLPPHVTTGLLAAAAGAWSAEAVQRGRSFLAGREGQPVASACIHLVDDGTVAKGLGTAPVDEEGTPSGRTALVNAGRLAGFLHNEETARRGGVRSTGNGRRSGLQTPPGVEPSNFMLLPGSESPQNLGRRAAGVFYVVELLGLHTLDPVTGEFSVGASGWLLAGGEYDRPVRGVTLAGTLEQLLSQVAAVGNDATAYGNFSAPTLWVHDMMVAGK